MDASRLEKTLAGEPKYRLKQVKQAVFCDLIEDWKDATNLPLDLREKLIKECPLKIKAEILTATDENSAKAAVELEDGLKIESVLMRHKDGRNTVCVSSQAGCPLACVFCATGRMGFKRSLKVDEIVKQVLLFARHLKKDGKKVTGVVFMGMGEPFLNYENVMEAIRILHDKDGFGLGARHFSISTAGIIEGIKKFAQEKLEINLAISFHAPTDALRAKIMPVAKKYAIKDILEAVGDYVKKTRRRVMFEYLMIDSFNDSDDCARQLSRLMKRPLCFVNLIRYNPTGIFKPSSVERVKKFKKILENAGVAVTERYRFGGGIKAACGQLAGRD